MTLDAGGTNFVFSALSGGKEVVNSIHHPSNAHDLDLCLRTLIKGFEEVKAKLPQPPVAISFAFPGPADYKNGIIGKLPNLPAFNKSNGVALGPMLEDHFKLPVFIGNDGDLFTLAESAAGVVPFINEQLAAHGVNKAYKNLFGITLGTGFGAGMVINNRLNEGDNGSASEVWLTRNFRNTNWYSECSVGVRPVLNHYQKFSGRDDASLTPKDIHDIALGNLEGDQQAALLAFREMALVIAESLCNAITLIDGLIVIGGGLAGAFDLIAPDIILAMNGTICKTDGTEIPRLIQRVYNLEDPHQLEQFLAYRGVEIEVPFSKRKVFYAEEKRIGICKTKLGTSQAVALGAYVHALQHLS
ncbi:ROK family protein [Pseudochryseolinea flava]|uniref:ROK family protein n=2 Tax=Pseudochryseolinea flava TaxID=2059302 RepID=A0A364XY38_9BACT|nr:ROK family protein [Pseudochryseolinea flava]